MRASAAGGGVPRFRNSVLERGDGGVGVSGERSRRISSLNKMIPDQGGGRDFVRRVAVGDERLLIRGAKRRGGLDNAASHWSRHAAVMLTSGLFTVPLARSSPGRRSLSGACFDIRPTARFDEPAQRGFAAAGRRRSVSSKTFFA